MCRLKPLFWTALLVVAISSNVHSQGSNPLTQAITAPDICTVANIEARIQSIKVNLNVDDPTHESGMELYTAAISQLEAALWFRQTANELAAGLKAAPATLEETRTYLETPLEEQINLSLAATLTDQTLEELESLLLSIEASATASQNEGQRGEESLNQAHDRPNAFSQRINVLRQRLAEIETTLRALKPRQSTEGIIQARRVLLETEHSVNLAETGMLESKLLGHDTRTQLLAVRLDRLTRKMTISDARQTSIEAQIAQGRRDAAAAAQTEATITQLDAVGRYPIVAAQQNIMRNSARNSPDWQTDARRTHSSSRPPTAKRNNSTTISRLPGNVLKLLA